MAETMLLLADKSIYIDSETPSSNCKTTELQCLDKGTTVKDSSREAYITFSGWPQKKRVISAALQVYVRSRSVSGAGGGEFYWCTIDSSYEMDSVSHNNQPSTYYIDAILDFTAVSLNAYCSIPTTKYYRASRLAKNGLNLDVSFVDIAYETHQISAVVDSTRGANPPRLLITYEDVLPSIAINSQRPSYGFVNDKAPAWFSWTVKIDSPDSVIGEVAMAGAKFQWRGVDGIIHEILSSEPEARIIVPPNTFPAAEAFEWRVAATTEMGVTGPFSEWCSVTTIDKPSTSKAIAPRGVYLAGNEPNEFSWQHVIPSGSAPSKAELQYSLDFGGTWTGFASVTGEAQRTVILPDTLPGGNLLWRVRTANSDGVWGPWSEPASIVVQAAPRAPSLQAIEGVPCPVIRWQSLEQQAFEVQIDGVSSCAIFGTEKEYRSPLWLSDGSHSVGVRIQSALGLWSPWATGAVAVKNVPPGALTLTSRAVENGARLHWGGATEVAYATYLIYRDGALIAQTDEQDFTDWLATGPHRYRVRGVKGAYYALSNEVLEHSVCRTGVLSAVQPIDWIGLSARRGGSPSHSIEGSRRVTMRYFAGRMRPVAEVSPIVDRTHTLEYSLRGKDRAVAERLQGLVGETVIYKNQHSDRVIGVLTEVSDVRDWAVDLTLTIVEVDWREG